MSRFIIILSTIITLAGCSDDPENTNGGSAGTNTTGSIFYEDVGFSNIVPTCAESSQRILDSAELDMTKARIREFIGKPRHVQPAGEEDGVLVGERWHFGHFLRSPPSVIPDWYFLTTVSFASEKVDSLSGDNTECPPDGGDVAFVEAANNYTLMGDTTDYTDTITDCFDAAVRIASRIEVGMTASQVRTLVGKPVEITESGVWRYSFGILPAPAISFSKSAQSAVGAFSNIVVGYTSIDETCNLIGL